ncbi:MAG: ATP-binding protein, partial [Saprospiraceae bacterium]|nr:ATP-binding protein [Saprospiraceae bacterium]
DLLEYARLSEEKKIEKLNLGEVIKEVLFKFDAQIKDKNATVFIPENMPRIDGNRRQLSSLFQNLIENGLKYNDSEKPNIQINWERQEDAHLIRIKDNGIGIKPEHQKKVFEMFKRLHDRSKYKGSGVGLAICKKIVEEHQGEIWIEENPDGGSTFALRFKAASIIAPQTKERLLSLTF